MKSSRLAALVFAEKEKQKNTVVEVVQGYLKSTIASTFLEAKYLKLELDRGCCRKRVALYGALFGPRVPLWPEILSPFYIRVFAENLVGLSFL